MGTVFRDFRGNAMIEIIVTGDTFDIKSRLKDNKFRWNPESKEWGLTVTEVRLNSTLDALRPMRSMSDHQPKVYVSLTSVDINHRQMGDKVLRIDLKPEGERVVDFLALLTKESQPVQVITNNSEPTTPPDSDNKRMKKDKNPTEGFF